MHDNAEHWGYYKHNSRKMTSSTLFHWNCVTQVRRNSMSWSFLAMANSSAKLMTNADKYHPIRESNKSLNPNKDSLMFNSPSSIPDGHSCSVAMGYADNCQHRWIGCIVFPCVLKGECRRTYYMIHHFLCKSNLRDIGVILGWLHWKILIKYDQSIGKTGRNE